eukprot:Lithocolla_globosa_v1_NODE_4541_length_1413_cov_13.224595.p1 type:complete len:143 gc:universal NODE_4541_length_1413_cov_13.224595:685-257(-)
MGSYSSSIIAILLCWKIEEPVIENLFNQYPHINMVYKRNVDDTTFWNIPKQLIQQTFVKAFLLFNIHLILDDDEDGFSTTYLDVRTNINPHTGTVSTSHYSKFENTPTMFRCYLTLSPTYHCPLFTIAFTNASFTFTKLPLH